MIKIDFDKGDKCDAKSGKNRRKIRNVRSDKRKIKKKEGHEAT